MEVTMKRQWWRKGWKLDKITALPSRQGSQAQRGRWWRRGGGRAARYLRSPTCRFLFSVAIVVLKQGTVCKHKGSGRIPDHAHHPKKHIHHLHQKAVRKLSTFPNLLHLPHQWWSVILLLIFRHANRSHPHHPQAKPCLQIQKLGPDPAQDANLAKKPSVGRKLMHSRSRRNIFRHHHHNHPLHYHHCFVIFKSLQREGLKRSS